LFFIALAGSIFRTKLENTIMDGAVQRFFKFVIRSHHCTALALSRKFFFGWTASDTPHLAIETLRSNLWRRDSGESIRFFISACRAVS
jgi:hypothetical protein